MGARRPSKEEMATETTVLTNRSMKRSKNNNKNVRLCGHDYSIDGAQRGVRKLVEPGEPGLWAFRCPGAGHRFLRRTGGISQRCDQPECGRHGARAFVSHQQGRQHQQRRPLLRGVPDARQLATGAGRQPRATGLWRHRPDRRQPSERHDLQRRLPTAVADSSAPGGRAGFALQCRQLRHAHRGRQPPGGDGQQAGAGHPPAGRAGHAGKRGRARCPGQSVAAGHQRPGRRCRRP
ncbi:hypothetical protein D3C80_977400 [compost metagenome]